MQFPTTSALLALAATPLAAAAAARVHNQCSFPMTLWTVGAGISPAVELTPGGFDYVEVLTRDPVTGGRAIKMTRTPNGLFDGSPQLIFAYNLDPNGQVWYDLSTVFGNAVEGSKLVVASAEPTCPTIVWPQGTPPAGSQVKVCRGDRDVTLTLCAS